MLSVRSERRERSPLPIPLRSAIGAGEILAEKELSSRFPLRANHEDRDVDLVGAGGSNPVRAGARRPFRFAQGISEGERPSTSRM